MIGTILGWARRMWHVCTEKIVINECRTAGHDRQGRPMCRNCAEQLWMDVRRFPFHRDG